MNEIRLPKLPDGTPIKLTLTIGADLGQALKDYADLYHAQYGVSETITDLIPFMREAFLQSDKGFNRGSRKL